MDPISLATHMRRFKGRPNELYSDANFLTDAKEDRSSSIISILASGTSLIIASLTFLQLSTLRTAIITLTPCNARIRAVSDPMPLDAPEKWTR